MKLMKKIALLGMAMGITTGAANAAVVNVPGGDITTSQTWTADNTYNLQGQVYITNGATLTIEAGTLVASTPTANGSGSLAVTQGSKIFVCGTEADPVIMTSTNDDFSTWRAAANEWGNLTIMGKAYISRSYDTSNTATFGNNIAAMEGLVASNPADPTSDPNVIYGGTDDDDDSGSISYLSLRYGGRVVGLTNELNGLSLGGIGRATDICFVEIMNNVDDGIEIWGGTVEIKNASIWNIGDDSFDVDQGWRGKAQNIFIVQGYSLLAKQGSGVGDNCFETDGAEDSDAQPVTTAVVYNATVVGNPLDGDNGTAWRDNASLQYRNSIFMDLGDKLIKNDGDDGDGASGYGFNGTLDFATRWQTAAGTHSTVNAGGLTPAQLDTLYAAQVDGFLSEISGSVFFRNLKSGAYSVSDTVGPNPGSGNTVTVAGGSNAALDNIVAPFVLATPDANMPIVSLTRGAPVDNGLAGSDQKDILPVATIDPRAANAATSLVSASPAPLDGFFSPQNYRGAFSPKVNWLLGWSAADEYGFLASPANPADPTVTLKLTATTCFQTQVGCTYEVQCLEGKKWVTVAVIEGDGAVVNYTDLDGLTAGKIYRAVVQ